MVLKIVLKNGKYGLKKVLLNEVNFGISAARTSDLVHLGVIDVIDIAMIKCYKPGLINM